MEKQAKIRSLPFLSAMAYAEEHYDLVMKEDDFIEMGYKVWREIGNIAPVKTRYFTKVPDDFIVELPRGCEFIDSVTSIQLRENISGFDSSGYKQRNLPAVQIASSLPLQNESITSTDGESINYILEVGAIRITSEYMLHKDIMIVYSSILVGEDGLPLLNDKEVAAIAAEVTRRSTVRDSFRGIKSKQAMLEYITNESNRLMTAAKIDERINDDEIDKMLDIKNSFNYKVHGKRFNPLR